jgi:hypothetical protein
VVLLGASHAFAGTKALGVEIGVTTVDQLRADLSAKTEIEERGINKFSAGPTLATKGDSYEVDGLTEVVYIFDDHDKLAGVILQMNKDRFGALFKLMNAKYKVVTQQRPFVGDQFVRFKTADATIELEAPHLSFTMEVRYVRHDLLKKFLAQSEAEAAAKKKKEAAKF